MNSELIIESGLQVVTRLIDRPSVQNLDNDLFFNELGNTDIVEIKGTLTSGMTTLLTKLIAKCILPTLYDGCNMDVLLINTDNQFQINQLANMLHREICDIQGPTNVDGLVKELLNNLKIINCYDYQQFLLVLNSLDNILLKNKKVGLVAIDSISAFYWQHRDDQSYDSYLLKLLMSIRKITIEFKVVTIYTKPSIFVSKKCTQEWFEGKKHLRYQISLSKCEKSDDFNCYIKSRDDEKHLRYKIEDVGIVWVKQENK